MAEFDGAILKLHGDYQSVPLAWVRRRRNKDDQEPYEDEGEENMVSSFGDDQVMTQPTHAIREINSISDFDAYVHAEVILSNDEGIIQSASLLGQSTSSDSDPIGEYDDNPMLNTREHAVMFLDGIRHQFSANIFAQNIYKISDKDGFRYQLLEEIIHYRKTKDTVAKEDGYIVTKNGQKKRKNHPKTFGDPCTMEGWTHILCSNDGYKRLASCGIVRVCINKRN